MLATVVFVDVKPECVDEFIAMVQSDIAEKTVF